MNLNSPTSPTLATYTALQQAFDHFNAELFSGELPACLIQGDRILLFKSL